MHCPSCGAPTAAGDRFCSTCGHQLSQRCETCGTVLPDGARFCPSCGTPVRGTEVTPEPDRPDEERKIVSVLFADLVGEEHPEDGEDPEDVRSRLRPYHAALRAEVERYGGRIEKLMGDGVLAVFGAPVVHEDDPERAVRAGLRIQEAISGLAGSTGLSARVAVATGEVVVLVEGTTMDREGLVGDVVNTASRLQHEAAPGSVLVDGATHRSTHRAFQYEERPPVAVKGKVDPIQVWVAVAPTGRFGIDVDDDGVAFVGRTSELSLVVDAFERAIGQHTTQLVTIGGEPGVGKSRLVRELRRHVDDLPDLIRWRQGRCLPYGEGIAYWALGEIVKAEAGILETDTPATAVGKLRVALEPLLADADERSWVAGRLAPLVGSEEEATADRSERFAAWHRFVAALAEQRPTVLVFEDLQWADQALVDFVAALPEATRGTPLLLVCTARPDFFEEQPAWGGGQRDAMTVRLDPLDPEETAALLDQLLEGEDLDADTRQVITERSGGNPLWTQEFVRMLRDRPAGDDLAVPDTVQAIVAARIDLLDPEVKTVVQAASTIGKSFWVGAVGAALEVSRSDLEEAMRELSRRELIRRERVSTVEGEVEYAFTHAVVRDVAYSQAPRRVRSERHHRVARWLEALAGDRVSDRAEVIAHHDSEALRLATAAGVDDVTELVEAAIASHRRAAEQAARLDRVAEQGHLEAALSLLPSGDPRRGRLLHDLGEVSADVGRLDEGRKMLAEARTLMLEAGDVEGWGLASSLLSVYAWVAGEMGAASRYLEEAIERLEQDPPGPALALAYSHRAGQLWLRGDSSAALAEVERVRDVVEVHGELGARRRVVNAEGGARFDLGDGSGIAAFREDLRLAIQTDDSNAIARAHLNLGEQLRTGFGFGEALPVHERGLELAEQRRTVGPEQFLRLSLAVDYFETCRWDDALAQVEAFRRIDEPFPYLVVGILGIEVVVRACRTGAGDPDRIDEQLSQAEGLKDLQALIPSRGAALWHALAVGDGAQAVGQARAIVETAGATRYLLDEMPATVWTLHTHGELGRLEPLLEDLRRFEMPRPRAHVAVVEAVLGADDDPAAAVEALESAAEDQLAMQAGIDAVVSLALAADLASAAGLEDRTSALKQRGRAVLEPSGGDALLAALALA